MTKLYIANLGKYNEGELVGAWIELPLNIDLEDFLMEKVGINEEYEEYAIHDSETDIEGLVIGEYKDIEELSSLVEKYEDLDESEMLAVQAYLENGKDFKSALDNTDDGNYNIYYNVSDMEDVAMKYVEETGLLSDMPERLQNYFDYKTFGRDMELEGTFIFVDSNCVELQY